MNSIDYDIVIIGGGAAGFFAAINAATLQPGLSILIAEKSNKVLQKVKVSGGGRCNVTHACFQMSEMVKRYPRGEAFLKKAFHHFFTTDTIEWFKNRGVKLHTESDGRMFPVSNNSQTIIDCLMGEVNILGIQIQYNCSISNFKYTGEFWDLSQANNTIIKAKKLCIACGGFSKADQFNWILQSAPHTFSTPVPSLFTFNIPGHPIRNLMGISVPQAEVKIAGFKLATNGPVLITHWGLSGPAVLRLSAFAARWLAEKNYAFTVIINWVPTYNENTLRQFIIDQRQLQGTLKITNTTWFGLPQRLWLFLIEQSGIDAEMRWAVLPAPLQNKLVKNLCGYELLAQGKTTYKEEFVTAGGITLSEIDPNTMQSRLHPNLYFAGEIIDVDGITGGYNFQNAWTTGFIAAKAMAAHY